MIINAKCTFDDIKQFNDRVINKGAKSLEIQIINNIGFYSKEDIANILQNFDVKINVVHLKLLKNDATSLLNILDDVPDFYERIHCGFSFAQKLAEIQGMKSVGVVIHSDISNDKFEYLVNNYIFRERIEMLLTQYPNTHILIENVMLLRKDKDGCISGRSGCFFEPCNMAKRLNQEFKTDRFYTCLDICHALSSIRIANSIFKERYTLDDFFYHYADNIGLIHLSYCKEFGFDKDHGLPYTLDEVEDLKEFLGLYYEHNYTCPITIEVYEDNYHDAQNYATTHRVLKFIQDSEVK